MKKIRSHNKGFTLIEILVVIGMIAILATIVIIAINPGRQFAQGRDTQRTANLNTILNAIGQRIADNKGKFDGLGIDGKTCPTLPQSGATVPNPMNTGNELATSLRIDSTAAAPSAIDLTCLVPTYVSSLPLDPADGAALNTGYYAIQDNSASGMSRITLYTRGVETALNRTNYITTTR
jgi:prepilin-type N-terminal cleavage/methylation domain-containing protein